MFSSIFIECKKKNSKKWLLWELNPWFLGFESSAFDRSVQTTLLILIKIWTYNIRNLFFVWKDYLLKSKLNNNENIWNEVFCSYFNKKYDNVDEINKSMPKKLPMLLIFICILFSKNINEKNFMFLRGKVFIIIFLIIMFTSKFKKSDLWMSW